MYIFYINFDGARLIFNGARLFKEKLRNINIPTVITFHKYVDYLDHC